MEGLMKTTVVGASGAKYPGQLLPLDAKLGRIECVYIIIAFQPHSMEYGTVYVGETANLEVHVAEHSKRDCWRREGASHVAIYRTHSSTRRRREIVSDIFAQYHCPCNEENSTINSA